MFLFSRAFRVINKSVGCVKIQERAPEEHTTSDVFLIETLKMLEEVYDIALFRIVEPKTEECQILISLSNQDLTLLNFAQYRGNASLHCYARRYVSARLYSRSACWKAASVIGSAG